MAKYIQKCPYFGAIGPYQGYISAETLFAKNQIFHKNSYKGKKTDLWTTGSSNPLGGLTKREKTWLQMTNAHTS